DNDTGIDINDVPVDRDYYMPSTSAGVPAEKASAILDQFSRKRKVAAIAVPTDDGRVRTRLRELGEPITIFGERPEDRRDRLRHLLYAAEEAENGADRDTHMREGTEEPGADDEIEEEFYSNGIQELLQARRDIARYSIPRAQARVEAQKLESTILVRTHVKFRTAIKERLSGFELFGSQVAGDRPVGIARFAPNGQTIAAGTWGGTIKLLDVPNLEEKAVLRGHTDRVGGIAWYPGATLPGTTVSDAAVNMASSGGEGDIHLWSLTRDTPISTLSGHSGRVCRIAFHPSGKYLASASYDTTWRLWDVATTTELLLQEGHSREVYTVAFNSDGSLLASAGLDSIGRIWDLRTGRTVMFLDSHIQPIYAVDWSSDGYRVLSGSGDGFAKCWDMRAVRETGSIGAHKGGITDINWYKGTGGLDVLSTTTDVVNHSDTMEVETPAEVKVTPKKAGTFFVSGGFDHNVNIFSADDWALCKSLVGHNGNVLSVDVEREGKWIVSSGYDRTVKLWAMDDGEGV
ncbi:hypothetical protein LTR66_007304, partial [Elasticomyces elasticus]